MSQPAQIPGFYYDPEKRKYFRILPTHAAPTAAFYSVASVASSQCEAQRAEQQKLEDDERAKRRINPLRTNSHVRVGLWRALEGKADREALRRIWVQGLTRRSFRTGVTARITAFGIAEGDGGDARQSGAGPRLVIGTSHGNVGVLPFRTNNGELTASEADVAPQIYLHSQVTSISLSSEWLLCTSMGERCHPEVHLSHLSHTYPGQTHALSSVRSVWTSSASSVSPSFVVGTSSSAIHLVAHPHTTQQTSHRIKSDVFATCFLPDSSTTFLAGSRDGDMRLFDVRSPTAQQRGEIVVRHGGTVTHIRALSSASIVVNGLGRCAAYDLRYPHPKSPSASFALATLATRVYAGAVGKKEFMIARGFDVDLVGGGELMAVADSERWMRMFSLVTGEELRSWRWEGYCVALSFDGERRLWASSGKSVECLTY